MARKTRKSKYPFWLRWLHSRFQEWYESREQARTWTNSKCPCCQYPVTSDEAHYCANCGQALSRDERHTAPVQQVSGERRTDALLTTLRPIQAYRHETHPDEEAGPATQKYRAINLTDMQRK